MKRLVKQLTTDDAAHILLESSHAVMRPAVQNYTDSVERVVVHYLLYHDSIRYSSRDCAKQINDESMSKLKSSITMGYECLKELVTFLRRSTIHNEAEVSTRDIPLTSARTPDINLFFWFRWLLLFSCRRRLVKKYAKHSMIAYKFSKKQLKSIWKMPGWPSNYAVIKKFLPTRLTWIQREYLLNFEKNQNNNDI